jgi:flagellar hook-associated protein 1 FlgK
MAARTLQINSMGMQVVGQNLANSNTAGYIREQLELKTAPTQRHGHATLGTGVESEGVTQVIDTYLEERLNLSISDASNSSTQEKHYTQLETLTGELTEEDLSTSLDEFFNSISNVLNQPESVSFRHLATVQGRKLSKDINHTSEQVLQMRSEVNEQIADSAKQINLLLDEIQELNMNIAGIEAGSKTSSQAVGLRDQRLVAVSKLSEIVNIRTNEDERTGMISVYCGSDVLVSESVKRHLVTEYETPEGAGMSLATLHIEETTRKLEVSSGRLAGMYYARDDIYGTYADQLDEYAETLVQEFNRIYTSGQGLTGYETLTAVEKVEEHDVALNEVGLKFPPKNGSFDFLVRNKTTGLTETTRIRVPLEEVPEEDSDADPFGLDPADPLEGMTLNDLRDAIDAVEGVNASINNHHQLVIETDAEDVEFAFSNDTSGVLAALGINVFFTGSKGTDIGVNQMMLDDPAKFAASKEGIGHDTDNAVDLANLPEQELPEKDDRTLMEMYQGMVNEMTQNASVTKSMAEGDRMFQKTLEAQKQSISGVNVDEETVQLMSFQRSYQASAKYIGVIDQMLETLISL